MEPRLLRSGLTGQVYIVTRYTDHPAKDGRPPYTLAHIKYDVTDQFNAMCAALDGDPEASDDGTGRLVSRSTATSGGE